MITFACVCTGTKYGPEYVTRLAAAVAANVSVPHRFVVLTDNRRQHYGCQAIDISHYQLPGWFAKMLVFNRYLMGSGRIIYLDLDTVIAGNIDALAEIDVDFACCQNFTQIRQARDGDVKWPCRLGSCAMVIGSGNRGEIWHAFAASADQFIESAGRYGDQIIIERLAPDVQFLQDLLPAGFFLHYRDFTETPDTRARILVFGGRHEPNNCTINWINELWEKPCQSDR